MAKKIKKTDEKSLIIPEKDVIICIEYFRRGRYELFIISAVLILKKIY